MWLEMPQKFDHVQLKPADKMVQWTKKKSLFENNQTATEMSNIYKQNIYLNKSNTDSTENEQWQQRMATFAKFSSKKSS